MMATTTLALQAARAYTQAGLCVIPIRVDGSKSPAVPEWTTYKSRLPTNDEAERLFGQSEVGVAVICGKVSGNLETLDFETVEVYEQWKDLVKNVQPNLVGKLVITETPGKYGPHGRHVRYRIADMDVPGNMKLAMNETGKECLIETRGEGGYALAPGSALQAHPTGQAYKNIQGVLSGIKTITAKERRVLISCAESLNQFVRDAGEKHNYVPPDSSSATGDRPGDIFNQRGDFSLLQKHGWKLVSQMANKCYWKRPGKDGPGISATSGYCKGADGTARLYVFSTNAEPFEAEKCYSPFSVYALLEHDGDFAKAAKSLKKEYGPVTISNRVPAEVIKQTEPEPLERELFPTGVFPEALQHTIDELARVIGCPTDSVGTLMLALASIGIGNTRKIGLRRTWKETSSLYMALVAFPGEGKSPVMQELAAPLYAWQHSMHEQHKQQMLDYAEAKEQHEADKKAGKESAAPPRPVYPHVYTTDATTEKLAEILNIQPRGVGMSQDEVTALVQGMNQYKQGGKGRDRQFYLSAWSGSPCKVDRKADNGIPLIVHDPFITIFGGIQPEMLGALKDEFGREDGFVHRFLFSYPPLRQLHPWGIPEIDPAAQSAWSNCFNKLITLSQHSDSDGKLRPWVCLMTAEATALWKQWYDRMIASMRDMPAQFRGPSHKLISYAARLSLILQMLYWATEGADNQRIDARAVEAGTALADYFANHLRIVYARLHDQPDDVKADELVDLIKKNGGKISVRKLVRHGPRWIRKASTAIKKLQDLEDRGYGVYYESDKNTNGTVEKWFEIKEKKDES